MTWGGEIRIPRAPGSPGKKAGEKGKIKCMAGAEAKRRHVVHGGFKSIISILTVYLWELTSCTQKFGLSTGIVRTPFKTEAKDLS